MKINYLMCFFVSVIIVAISLLVFFYFDIKPAIFFIVFIILSTPLQRYLENKNLNSFFKITKVVLQNK